MSDAEVNAALAAHVVFFASLPPSSPPSSDSGDEQVYPEDIQKSLPPRYLKRRSRELSSVKQTCLLFGPDHISDRSG